MFFRVYLPFRVKKSVILMNTNKNVNLFNFIVYMYEFTHTHNCVNVIKSKIDTSKTQPKISL